MRRQYKAKFQSQGWFCAVQCCKPLQVLQKVLLFCVNPLKKVLSESIRQVFLGGNSCKCGQPSVLYRLLWYVAGSGCLHKGDLCLSGIKRKVSNRLTSSSAPRAAASPLVTTSGKDELRQHEHDEQDHLLRGEELPGPLL